MSYSSSCPQPLTYCLSDPRQKVLQDARCRLPDASTRCQPYSDPSLRNGIWATRLICSQLDEQSSCSPIQLTLGVWFRRQTKRHSKNRCMNRARWSSLWVFSCGVWASKKVSAERDASQLRSCWSRLHLLNCRCARADIVSPFSAVRSSVSTVPSV